MENQIFLRDVSNPIPPSNTEFLRPGTNTPLSLPERVKAGWAELEGPNPFIAERAESHKMKAQAKSSAEWKYLVSSLFLPKDQYEAKVNKKEEELLRKDYSNRYFSFDRYNRVKKDKTVWQRLDSMGDAKIRSVLSISSRDMDNYYRDLLPIGFASDMDKPQGKEVLLTLLDLPKWMEWQIETGTASRPSSQTRNDTYALLEENQSLTLENLRFFAGLNHDDRISIFKVRHMSGNAIVECLRKIDRDTWKRMFDTNIETVKGEEYIVAIKTRTKQLTKVIECQIKDPTKKEELTGIKQELERLDKIVDQIKHAAQAYKDLTENMYIGFVGGERKDKKAGTDVEDIAKFQAIGQLFQGLDKYLATQTMKKILPVNDLDKYLATQAMKKILQANDLGELVLHMGDTFAKNDILKGGGMQDLLQKLQSYGLVNLENIASTPTSPVEPTQSTSTHPLE